MDNINVYSIREDGIGFNGLILLESDIHAVKYFEMFLLDSSNNQIMPLARNFDLFKIGEFDPELGIMFTNDRRMRIITGAYVLKNAKDKDGFRTPFDLLERYHKVEEMYYENTYDEYYADDEPKKGIGLSNVHNHGFFSDPDDPEMEEGLNGICNEV